MNQTSWIRGGTCGGAMGSCWSATVSSDLLGCQIDDLLERFGNPDAALAIGGGTLLSFGDVVLVVEGGLVCRVARRFDEVA